MRVSISYFGSNLLDMAFSGWKDDWEDELNVGKGHCDCMKDNCEDRCGANVLSMCALQINMDSISYPMPSFFRFK